VLTTLKPESAIAMVTTRDVNSSKHCLLTYITENKLFKTINNQQAEINNQKSNITIKKSTTNITVNHQKLTINNKQSATQHHPQPSNIENILEVAK
jgi:predicted O-linked N-acetylglucosamine transferase (SPINDLY family)